VKRLEDFWSAQSEWSQRTFGADSVRGPVGALRHLQRECDEAIADPSDVIEFADCLILLLDATRRAGHTLDDLVSAAERKAEINRSRTWPSPPPVDDGRPLEHVEVAPDSWYAAEVARLRERAPA
jgi:hypothetical protein